jgi:quinol monooxygenase YgiN
MIVVAAHLDYATSEIRNAVVVQSAPIQMATRTDEAGCHAYCFAVDPSIDTRIQVYELWEDQESLAAHFLHPNYEAMKVLLVSNKPSNAWNRMYLVAKDEPVYGPNGEIRSTFFVD